MSWISDVRSELKHLKRTPKEVRKFAYLVGSLLLIIGGDGVYKHWNGAVVSLLLIIAFLLLVCGAMKPQYLTRVYGAWMGIAFGLGWIVSRAILILLFYLVITPVGLLARLFGKKFIDVSFPGAKESYWVPRIGGKKMHYEKMF
ncbi:MAG TPA: SxtJ family membrane protein [Bacteroidota bacterium]|nr:SxtJ family membrane protein [Bacteroidota bacterium]